MLTLRQNIVNCVKAFAIVIAIFSASLFTGLWALRPYMDSRALLIHGPPIYRFRFVQPHWLSNPDTWPLIETVVRSAVLGHGVVFLAVWWARRRLRTQLSKRSSES